MKVFRAIAQPVSFSVLRQSDILEQKPDVATQYNTYNCICALPQQQKILTKQPKLCEF